MMRHALVAALLIAAGGCGDDSADCPSGVGQGGACSTTLTCFQGAQTCACKSGAWDCNTPVFVDMRVPDLSIRDMTPASD